MQLLSRHAVRASAVRPNLSHANLLLAAFLCGLLFFPSDAPAQELVKSGSGAGGDKPASPVMKRRDKRSEAELLAQLQSDATVLDVRAVEGFCERLAAMGRAAVEAEKQSRRDPSTKRSSALPAAVSPTLALIKQREDLHGLPLREGDECKKERSQARLMEEVSAKVQKTIREYIPDHTGGLAIRYPNENGLVPPLGKVASLYGKDHLSTLIQMFQPQAAAVRMKLVELLAAAREQQATVFIAQRAIFDPSPQVREAAVKALRGRSPSDYRGVLLKGLRYPWAPVADHAAEALVALQESEVLPQVAALLDQPDPRTPFADKDNILVVPQIVAVNHLRNCLLCHAPSFNDTDPVRGAVPEPGRSLSPRYYDGGGSQTIFARADITYLQQDFSAFQECLSDAAWPTVQRFDYLIRNRPLTAEDSRLYFAAYSRAVPESYPQREAALFVLRESTGEELGTSARAWREFFAMKKSGRPDFWQPTAVNTRPRSR
jgi:hypothetical protein